ncbi:MAG: glycosyltransferase family 4 protein [Anaerolineae bacterium]
MNTPTSYIAVGQVSNVGDQNDGGAPRLDYRLVVERLGAQVLAWHPSPSGLAGPRWLRDACSFVPNLASAVAAQRDLAAGSIVYTTGETWGLPLGLAARYSRVPFTHVMYVHRVFSPRWLRALHLMRHRLRVDGWICVTAHQAELLRESLGPEARITAVSQGVDTTFYDPALVGQRHGEPYALCVGAEMRDYHLLFEAVRNLPIRVVVRASSAWMKSSRKRLAATPENIEVLDRHQSYVELRALYSGARLVVVPLYNTPQAAGITTILEGMAMSKCVLATFSAGVPDVLRDGVNGRIVAGDAPALRAALRELWDDCEQRERLGRAGYVSVRTECSLEQHADRVASFVRDVATLNQKTRGQS